MFIILQQFVLVVLGRNTNNAAEKMLNFNILNCLITYKQKNFMIFNLNIIFIRKKKNFISLRFTYNTSEIFVGVSRIAEIV